MPITLTTVLVISLIATRMLNYTRSVRAEFYALCVMTIFTAIVIASIGDFFVAFILGTLHSKLGSNIVASSLLFESVVESLYEVTNYRKVEQ